MPQPTIGNALAVEDAFAQADVLRGGFLQLGGATNIAKAVFGKFRVCGSHRWFSLRNPASQKRVSKFSGQARGREYQ